MATSEALIKYYDCLKDSFSKIQDKDNKTALINAALRPKIREEFAKSHEVLVSYLNYIQVFSLIYSDKFVTICTNIITPLLKENPIRAIGNERAPAPEASEDTNERAAKVHETIEAIVSSRPELAHDFVHSVIKVFPSVSGTEDDKNQAFLTFLKNCLKICTYLRDEPLSILVTKILEKLNPPPMNPSQESEETEAEVIRKTFRNSYELIYECLDDLNESQLEIITNALLTTFTRDFLSSPAGDHFKYLLLYICSLNVKFANRLIVLLWTTFTNSSRPLEERRTSAIFACSFMSRANYVDLDQVFNFLETANSWCEDFLDEYVVKIGREDGVNERVESFNIITQSMFYLITQRYREMYEEESIARLTSLNLDRIIKCPLKPLEACDIEIQRRFQEVATLYSIADLGSIRCMPLTKRRKSEHRDPKHQAPHWNVPFRETCDSTPERILPLYRNYYDHRNFTIYRE